MNEVEMITEQDFFIDELVRKMKKPEPGLGCIVSFLGVVRADEGLTGMEIEIKDETKAEKELEFLKREAIEKFDVEAVEIVHRKGSLEAGDNIVAILVGAKHRKEAFRACEYLIDVLRISEAIRLK
ncbi:MAG: molybdenum cofactor biosynthesis protein MoaE, partial [Euryarchaeota archaeon]|nr:molybdenum cofactor biosynthesis protein MoaE [Euryarchaeota archaeon]